MLAGLMNKYFRHVMHDKAIAADVPNKHPVQTTPSKNIFDFSGILPDKDIILFKG